MIGRLNFSCKPFVRILAVAILCICAQSASAQLFKKKKGEVPHTDYAYQTHSTLGKKQKVHSHGGSSDPKFHVEKPVRPTPYRNGRVIKQRDSFGKKISPSRNSRVKTKKNRGSKE